MINITPVRCFQNHCSTCFFPTILKEERLCLDLLWHLRWQLHCRTSSSVACLNVAQGKCQQLSMLSQAQCLFSACPGLVLGWMAPTDSFS